jgi:hypothetical protein
VLLATAFVVLLVLDWLKRWGGRRD